MRLVTHSLAALSALVLAPVGLVALALSPKRAIGLPERLGALAARKPGAIWIHGASVGEVQVARRLAETLRSAGHEVLLSTMTVTGKSVARNFQEGFDCALCPLDHPWSVKRAMDAVQPSTLILIETELWPFWIAEAHSRGVPVLIASGRISDRSFPRYRRFGKLVRSILQNIDGVAARTALDAERFVALGAHPSRVQVLGDLKFDPPRITAALASDLAAFLQPTPIFVAASTHAGEETAALRALAAAEHAGFGTALVVAPRHIERVEAVEKELRASGRCVQRRSALSTATVKPLQAGEILLVDTLGELNAIFSRAAIVFVGGTLVGVGGHNVLEPAWARVPVLFGPHTQNLPDAVNLLLAAKAAQCVTDAEALGRALIEWLRDPAQAAAAGARGYAAVQAHCGATARTAAFVQSFLKPTREHMA